MTRKSIAIVAACAAFSRWLSFAAVADARTAKVAFTRAPATALQGKVVKIAVSTKPTRGPGAHSVIRYHDGAVEKIDDATAGRRDLGLALPEVAQPGRTSLSVSCLGAGSVTRLVTVVGTLIPPKIVVADQGFSVRARTQALQ